MSKWEDAPSKQGAEPRQSASGWEDAPSAEIPSPEESLESGDDLLGGVTKVAQATGIGAGAGLIAPELVTAAGMAMMAIPPVAPFAPFVMGAGRAMRGARMASGLSGAIGGGLGETAGQAVEAAGGSATSAELARLGVGTLGPEAARLATKPFTAAGGYGLSLLANKLLPGSLGGTGLRTVGQILEGQKSGAPVDLTEPQKQFFEKQLQRIRGGDVTSQPYLDIMQMLRSNTQRLISQADTTASQLERDAAALIAAAEQSGGRLSEQALQRVSRLNSQFEAAAMRITDNAQKQSAVINSRARTVADAIRNRAAQQTGPQAIQEGQRNADNILQAAEADSQRILADADAKATKMLRLRENLQANITGKQQRAAQQIGQIGAATTPTELGTSIRQGFTKELDRLKGIREANVQTYKKEAFDEALAKEFAGQRYQDTPQFREVVQDISAMIRQPETALLKAAPEQKQQLTRILDLLRRGEGRQDAETGEMIYTKLGFEGLENVRRMLRDRAYGLPAEGYDAINQQQAGDLAKQVEKTMEAFSPKLRKYIDQYRADSEPINKFRTKLGKAMTGVEEFDLATFVTDPILLGSQAFRSATSVRQMIDTLGKDETEQFARTFLADKVRGGTANDVRKALDDSRDWVGLFPNLAAQLNQVAERVGLLERVAGQRGSLAKTLRTQFRELRPAERERAAKVVEKAVLPAQRAEEAGVREADQIISKAERTAGRLESGKATEAAQAIKGAESQIQASAGTVARRAGDITREAERTAGAELKQATSAATALTAQAKKVRDEAQSQARLILGGKAPEIEIPKLIQGADLERLNAIAPILLADPRGKEAFAQAMGQRVARMMQTMTPSRVTNEVRDFTGELVRLNLVSEDQVKQLLQKVNEIYVMPLDAAGKATAGQRLVRNFFTGYVAPGVGRDIRSIVEATMGDRNATQTGVQP